MKIKRWVARREANWQRLHHLLGQVEKRGLQYLSAQEIQELASLYRSVSGDLARARTHQVGDRLIQELQQLTTRGYHQIYQGSRHQEWAAVGEFILWGFPRVVQQTWGYTAIATSVFFGAGIIAWWYAWTDPVFLEIVVPDRLITMVRDERELWMGSILGIEPLASTNIMINNLRVSFSTVGGGITAGLVTLYILVLNGVFIGAIAALVGQYGLAYPFWAFVFPHGSLELPAIFLAGGAGLLIARALVAPGQYSRVDALKVYGTQAAQLVFGVVALLVVAGVIEGFFSPNPLFPDVLKYLVGGGLFALLVLYCRRVKRVES
ncbi:stage II sporulation protein M [Spirulina sp. CS-785/01]|uniref:stage II sporulation protein M n=1 Tax=Spirulina sp. CS-785/01 TaxID=3021716 RepID=UPI0023300DA1|nr:stage II sporulation protein M [Spirulina sp. CS-785/01]MDB9314231.1 stage II sporulation protein M [Spirulina sp. CS-785/01]